MPGRQFGQGENFPGVLVNGTTTVNGYTLPIDLSITGRVTGDAAEYVASNSVEFGGEFESSVSDEFSAYIADGSYAGTGNQVTGGGAYGTAGRYRYGFGGQEMSNEIKGVGISYTAEFWEYDPRVGRRWNIDPVNIGSTSGYHAFANNPIIFVDPFGLDTVRSSKEAKVNGDVFQHRNGNSNFFWNKTENGFEGGGSSESLSEVVVTARKKGGGSNYLNWPNSTRSDRMQWNIDQHNYRLGDFNRLTQQIAKYQIWDKADQEWRQSSMFSLAVIAAPITAVGLVESGAAYYGYQGSAWLVRNYGMSLVQEVTKEALANRGSIYKMDWSDVFVSTALSRWKSLGANGIVEMINATSDLSIEGKYQNSFLRGTKYEKRLDKTASDLFFGGFRVKTGSAGFKDMTVDQIQVQFDLLMKW